MKLKAEDVKKIRSLRFAKRLLRQEIELNVQLNEELRHQKYKRCLAMGKLCRSEWAAAIFIPEKCLSYEYAKRYMRWKTRWLKLAKKFKEAKE